LFDRGVAQKARQFQYLVDFAAHTDEANRDEAYHWRQALDRTLASVAAKQSLAARRDPALPLSDEEGKIRKSVTDAYVEAVAVELQGMPTTAELEDIRDSYVDVLHGDVAASDIDDRHNMRVSKDCLSIQANFTAALLRGEEAPT